MNYQQVTEFDIDIGQLFAIDADLKELNFSKNTLNLLKNNELRALWQDCQKNKLAIKELEQYSEENSEFNLLWNDYQNNNLVYLDLEEHLNKDPKLKELWENYIDSSINNQQLEKHVDRLLTQQLGNSNQQNYQIQERLFATTDPVEYSTLKIITLIKQHLENDQSNEGLNDQLLGKIEESFHQLRVGALKQSIKDVSRGGEGVIHINKDNQKIIFYGTDASRMIIDKDKIPSFELGYNDSDAPTLFQGRIKSTSALREYLKECGFKDDIDFENSQIEVVQEQDYQVYTIKKDDQLIKFKVNEQKLINIDSIISKEIDQLGLEELEANKFKLLANYFKDEHNFLHGEILYLMDSVFQGSLPAAGCLLANASEMMNNLAEQGKALDFNNGLRKIELELDKDGLKLLKYTSIPKIVSYENDDMSEAFKLEFNIKTNSLKSINNFNTPAGIYDSNIQMNYQAIDKEVCQLIIPKELTKKSSITNQSINQNLFQLIKEKFVNLGQKIVTSINKITSLIKNSFINDNSRNESAIDLKDHQLIQGQDNVFTTQSIAIEQSSQQIQNNVKDLANSMDFKQVANNLINVTQVDEQAKVGSLNSPITPSTLSNKSNSSQK